MSDKHFLTNEEYKKIKNFFKSDLGMPVFSPKAVKKIEEINEEREKGNLSPERQKEIYEKNKYDFPVLSKLISLPEFSSDITSVMIDDIVKFYQKSKNGGDCSDFLIYRAVETKDGDYDYPNIINALLTKKDAVSKSDFNKLCSLNGFGTTSFITKMFKFSVFSNNNACFSENYPENILEWALEFVFDNKLFNDREYGILNILLISIKNEEFLKEFVSEHSIPPYFITYLINNKNLTDEFKEDLMMNKEFSFRELKYIPKSYIQNIYDSASEGFLELRNNNSRDTVKDYMASREVLCTLIKGGFLTESMEYDFAMKLLSLNDRSEDYLATDFFRKVKNPHTLENAEKIKSAKVKQVAYENENMPIEVLQKRTDSIVKKIEKLIGKNDYHKIPEVWVDTYLRTYLKRVSIPAEKYGLFFKDNFWLNKCLTTTIVSSNTTPSEVLEKIVNGEDYIKNTMFYSELYKYIANINLFCRKNDIDFKNTTMHTFLNRLLEGRGFPDKRDTYAYQIFDFSLVDNIEVTKDNKIFLKTSYQTKEYENVFKIYEYTKGCLDKKLYPEQEKAMKYVIAEVENFLDKNKKLEQEFNDCTWQNDYDNLQAAHRSFGYKLRKIPDAEIYKYYEEIYKNQEYFLPFAEKFDYFIKEKEKEKNSKQEI